MENKIIYCGNCGKKGHVYRYCHKPIISLGIICIKYDNELNNIIKYNKEHHRIFNKYNMIDKNYDSRIKNIIDKKIKFLMICRKHTIGYIEFIRGNYNIDNYNNIQYIENIFKLMTKNEIENIKKKDFDFLWNDVWVVKDNQNSHQKEYQQSKIKFNILLKGVNIQIDNKKNKIDLEYCINNCKIKWNEPEWEFPKGRRNIREEDLNCAIREFEEETDFKNQDYKLLDLNPISEIFMGTNGNNYKHTYYFAQSEKNNLTISENNIYQQIEISNIKWFTFEEAMDKIRSYNIERKKILEKIYNMLYFNIYYFSLENNLM
jgi:8-oxo-dGTP pyrophosphatase MutT (NUDIX family)